uniref:type IV pilus biogenesis/stability protein PilW n=1 Tax=Pseudoalteromonas sp. TaxID=53249 RepID=UPI003561BF9D
MRSLLILTLSTLALAGCVTENSYNGSDKPVVKNKINNAGAARTRIALALQYLNTGNNSQAKYNLERAHSYAPNLPEVHYSLAYYYQQVGENTLADKAYQKALAIKPDDPNTLNNYGVFLCGINEYDRATDQFLKAIEIPSYIRVAQSYENLALCAIEFNDFDNAESYFKQAINHSSQRASTLISLAALYYAKSDLYKATELLKRYEDTAQISARALLLNYLIKQRMGKIEAAEKIAATILQTYPSSEQAVALREHKIRHTEFEVLREKYRQAQLDKIQSKSDETRLAAKPKIKVVRKKRASQNDSTSLIASNTHNSNTQQPQVTVLQADAIITEQTVSATTTSTIPAAANTTSVENPVGLINTPAEKTSSTVDNSQNQPSAAVSKVQPAASTATQQNDVKIISFGAPQTANQSVAPVTNTSTPSSNANSGAVVFYQATKNPDVFNNTQARNSDTFALRNAQTNTENQRPMLNPNVAPLSVPFHIIEFGENLFSISVRYNVKLQKLLQWNGLKESDRVM